ncbi:hypothetical protein [Streptomyces poonensis]|uniref:Uncharacterized protein n=1 Tax=Streptomyces poonensis TaxID=68255 RepID=A0A918PDM5_9ACTN|nr:hypothetical protein [Streptomyces poonensis]GGZ01371.1 hypothetical protein GCM10010365_20460 [Streptomyces poonensis]GLJ90340.1 hypothetical protein GCM10017589_29430 [Streptomyces poonensis]
MTCVHSGCGRVENRPTSPELAYAESRMPDAADGSVEERGHVAVAEAVDDTATLAPPGDQAEGAQQARLV